MFGKGTNGCRVVSEGFCEVDMNLEAEMAAGPQCAPSFPYQEKLHPEKSLYSWTQEMIQNPSVCSHTMPRLAS